MKSTLIWLFSIFAGAGIGYGISFLINLNPFLLILFGVIIGSSAGITWNIHRERVEDLPDIRSFEDIEPDESEANSSDSINQKAS